MYTWNIYKYTERGRERVLDTDTLCVAAVGAIDNVDNLFRF